MIDQLLLIGAATGLAGCGGDPGAAVVSHDDIAEQMRRLANEGSFFQAGQWESTSEILHLDGLRPSEAAALKAEVGRQTFSTCLSTEEVTEPDADFFTGNASDCVYSRFRMGDGKIEAKMRCVTGNIVQDNELVGNYARDRYDFTLTSVGQPPRGSRDPEDRTGTEGSKMVMGITARRVGDCARLGRPRPAESTGEK